MKLNILYSFGNFNWFFNLKHFLNRNKAPPIFESERALRNSVLFI